MTDLIRKTDALAILTAASSISQKTVNAIAALPAVTVGVKPLVWEDRSSAVHPRFKAVTGFGTYYIERNKAGLFDWWSPYRMGKTEVKTLDAAKAAAQADYTARILAALEPVATTDPAAIREAAIERSLREAIAWADKHKWAAPWVDEAIAALIAKGAAE